MKDSLLKILKDRYFLSTESAWEDIAKRVSEIYPPIFDYINNMEFIPSSPTLMNANTKGERKGTLSSCFPMGKIDDSINGIFDAVKECAEVTKMGGGVGYDFSTLRSSQEGIKGIGGKNSSGPLPFINVFNSVLDGVQQGGVRRGAGMALLDITHPDILDFIDAKKNLNQFNRFNFSIKIGNDFYEKLEKTPDAIHIVKSIDKGTEFELHDKDWIPVTVKSLWDKILHSAWLVAEPGIFNKDTAYERCSVNNLSDTILSNPCFTGDTLVAVADGRNSVSIKQLVDEGVDIPVYTLNHKGEIEIKPFINPRLTQKQIKVYKVKFDSGLEIKCTANHKFLTTEGNFKEAIDLKDGDSIKNINKHKMLLTEAYPWMKKTSGQDYFIFENNGKKKAEHRIVAEYKINRKLKFNEIVHHLNYTGLDNSIDNLLVMTNKEHIDFHKKDMMGSKNSVFKIKDKIKWKQKLSEANKGLKNGNSKNISNEEIFNIIKEFSKNTVGNYFSFQHWKKLNLPLINTKKNTYRLGSVEEYCIKSGVEFILGVQYSKLEKQYNNLIINNFNFYLNKETKEFLIDRKCECCGNGFITDYEHRQVTFCSPSCLHKYIDKPFMFDKYKFSNKYLERSNVKERIQNTFDIIKKYKIKKYNNFLKEVKEARNIIRNNNPFAPSLTYIQENLNKLNSIEDIIKVAENNLKNFKDKHGLSEICGGFNHKVVSVSFYGLEDVYDGTVENNHTILVGGKEFINDFGKISTEWIVTSQCAEFVNIPYTSCALGSIDLSKLVEYRKFNWEKFETLIIEATRFINATLDVNNYPLKHIKETTLDIRPIGLGFMGLAHCLFKKGIPYNSKEAITFAKDMMLYMTLCAMKESVEIAKKDGVYPEFNYDVFMKANERFFKHNIKNIDVKQLQKDIKKHGVRNSCFTSIAPTGTLSTLAETSSGVEPVFALSYMRKVEKLNKQYDILYINDSVFENYVNNNFTEKECEQIFKGVSENKGSCQKCDLIPIEYKKIFITAGDLNPQEHLDMLEVINQGVSLSVSKTINLPEKITQEEMGDIFIDAYKVGIIGTTIYRDSCREGILVHNKKTEINRPDEIVYMSAPKRPKEIECDVHRINAMIKDNKGEKVQERFIIFVGLLNNKPYEFFVGKIEDVNIPKNIETGTLVRVKSGQYAFKYEDEILIHDINKTFHSEEFSTFSRLVSSLLRHGGHPKYVIDQLGKCPGTIADFSKATIRMLKKYITDGEEADSCSVCGTKKIYEGGCKKCPICGVSDCG